MKVLEEAIKLIEAGWCKGSLARNDNGDPISFDDSKAVYFCVVGAVRKACNGNILEADKLTRKLAHEVGWSELWCWNDMPDRTKEDVIGLLKQLSNKS